MSKKQDDSFFWKIIIALIVCCLLFAAGLFFHFKNACKAGELMTLVFGLISAVALLTKFVPIKSKKHSPDFVELMKASKIKPSVLDGIHVIKIRRWTVVILFAIFAVIIRVITLAVCNYA